MFRIHPVHQNHPITWPNGLHLQKILRCLNPTNTSSHNSGYNNIKHLFVMVRIKIKLFFNLFILFKIWYFLKLIFIVVYTKFYTFTGFLDALCMSLNNCFVPLNFAITYYLGLLCIQRGITTPFLLFQWANSYLNFLLTIAIKVGF